MAVINPLEHGSAGLLIQRERVEQKKRLPRNKFFTRRLEEEIQNAETADYAEDKNFNEQLVLLFNSVKDAGDDLQHAPTMYTIRNYREKVKSFIQFIINNAINAQESSGRINIRTGLRKKYLIIDIIDKKLNSLAQTLLEEQSANLQALVRVEEINGLLIDLMS